MIPVRPAAVAVGLLASPALAGGFSIGWSTIDGGGGMVSAGSYALSSTIGQSDAHGEAEAGAFGGVGGFWPGFGAGAGCNAADLAPPQGLLDLADINAFVAAFVGQDLLADVSGDGLLDLADISLFAWAFVAGCP